MIFDPKKFCGPTIVSVQLNIEYVGSKKSWSRIMFCSKKIMSKHFCVKTNLGHTNLSAQNIFFGPTNSIPE